MATFEVLDTANLDTNHPGKMDADHLTGDKVGIVYSYSGQTIEKIVNVAGDTINVDANTTLLSQTTEDNWFKKVANNLGAVVYLYDTGPEEAYLRGRSDSQGSTATRFDTNDSGNEDLTVAKLTTSRVVLTWRDAVAVPVRTDMLCRVADVSDSSITLYTTATLDDGDTLLEPYDACNLDSSYVAVLHAFNDTVSGADGLHVALISVSGTTPSMASQTELVATATASSWGRARLTRLSTDTCVAVFDDPNDSKMKAVRMVRSGTSMNKGSVVTLFNDTNHTIQDAKMVTSTVMLIVYRDTSNNKNYVQTLNVGGDPSLGGDEFEVNTPATLAATLAVLSTTRSVVFYVASSGSDKIKLLGMTGITAAMSGPAKFYFDVDDLTERATLQVSNVAPKAMEITVKKKAWIGSFTSADAVVVEQGIETDNFTNFTDQTGLIPTAYTVKAIRAI